MTTKVQINWLSDRSIAVNARSDGYNDLLPPGTEIATAELVVASGYPREAKHHVFNLIYRTANESIVTLGLEFWLMLGQSSWHDDSKVLRHKRLWGALRRIGINLRPDVNAMDQIVEKDGKIKFYGAVRLKDIDPETAFSILEDQDDSYIIAVPNGSTQELLKELRSGWTPDRQPAPTLVRLALENRGILFRSFGQFDDREAGYITIGVYPAVSGFLKLIEQAETDYER